MNISCYQLEFGGLSDGARSAMTELAGAELDPAVLRTKWRETGVIGLASFAAPFLGSAAYARYVLAWDPQARSRQ